VRAAVPAEDRSAHPAIRGVPWWGAILIAVGAALAGYAIDAAAGNGELTAVFATFYFVGCVAAVLAVRHTGIFTAVVQPPLILFVTVPGAYYLLHSSEIAGVKDLIINCFYPLIERFLLMFLTALAVLVIGVARWYFESTKHRTAGTGTGTTLAAAGDLLAGLRSRVSGLMSRNGGESRPENPGRTTRKPPRTRATSRPQRPSGQAASRSRHVRPPMDDPHAPLNPPQRRPAQPRDGGGPAEPPRRRRVPREPDYRREAWAPEPWQPPSREHPDRPRRNDPRNGRDAYDPYDLFGPSGPQDGAADSHLPSSNVRYRGGATADDDYRRPRG
jgi:hypothetical protein